MSNEKTLSIRWNTKCNGICEHCCMNPFINKDNCKIDLYEIRKYLDKNQDKFSMVYLKGSEPLLDEQSIYDILYILKLYPNLRFKLTTNLQYPLNKERMEVLYSIHELETSYDLGVNRFSDEYDNNNKTNIDQMKSIHHWRNNVFHIAQFRKLKINICLTKQFIYHFKSLDNFIEKLIFNKMSYLTSSDKKLIKDNISFDFSPISKINNNRNKLLLYIPTKNTVVQWFKDNINYLSKQNLYMLISKKFLACPNDEYSVVIDNKGNEQPCLATNIILDPETEDSKEVLCKGKLSEECLICSDYQYCGGKGSCFDCYFDREVYELAKSRYLELENNGENK